MVKRYVIRIIDIAKSFYKKLYIKIYRLKSFG